MLHATATDALTISPAKIEMNGDPGKMISGEFILMNEQSSSMTFYTSAENFEASGETGTPNFVPGTSGFASWVSLAPTVVLNKGEQKVVPFTIQIPVDADAGGHFAAIFLSTTPPQSESGQVSVGAKIGVLVFLHVSGEVREDGGILSFDTTSNDKVFTSLPISFSYRFQNSGNDRVKPEGTLHIKNIFGWNKAILNANKIQGNILPNSVRKFEVVWDDGEVDGPRPGFFNKAWYQLQHFAFGVYKAKVNLTYGQQQVTSPHSITFFVIPWQLLTLVAALLTILFYGGSKAIRSYNAWIIRKAQHSSVEQ